MVLDPIKQVFNLLGNPFAFWACPKAQKDMMIQRIKNKIDKWIIKTLSLMAKF